MSKTHEFERAFFSSLCAYNAKDDAVVTLKIGLLAAMMGTASLRHIRRYYPKCARV